jgi:hypothetical protein
MSYVKKKHPKKPGRKPGQFFSAPRNEKLIQRIIHLREIKNLTWREIGPLVGLSHQGPYLLYKRWRLGERTAPYVDTSRKHES